jgi:type I restriction enzyme S subunit
LEGLEAAEMKLSDCKSIIDFRIDANTYKKSYVATHSLIMTKQPKTIDDLSKSVQNFGAYSLCNLINFTDEGIPFLMTENVRHNYINWNIRKYVNEVEHNILYKSHCKKGQVLVTMAGEYLGRVAVYDKDDICSSNQAIAKVTLKDGINPYLVSTFLNSVHGQNQINRLKTITGQPNINMSLIKSLMVPSFSNIFQREIKRICLEFTEKRELSAQVYKEAELGLLNDLNLNNIQIPKENIANKSLTESFGNSGRIDAEYYHPKYEFIEGIIKSYSNGYTLLKNEFEHISTASKKDEQYYNYIEIGDINVSDSTCEYKSIAALDLPANAKILAEKGDLLVSKVRPNRGAVSTINFDVDNLIVSGAFTVLRQRKKSTFSIETLKVLLRTELYKEWLLKFNVGSSYPVIKDVDLLNLLIPNIPEMLQDKIKSQIEYSLILKKKSNELIGLVKSAVEIAIEQNEEAAFKYIEEYTNSGMN